MNNCPECGAPVMVSATFVRFSELDTAPAQKEPWTYVLFWQCLRAFGHSGLEYTPAETREKVPA
jgi:hypothetical protein